jgi:plasmid stability protein
MKNVTITLDEETAEWARVHAAQKGISLSRFVGEVLRQHLPQAQEYEQAMNRWLARRLFDRPLTAPGEKLPTREEIYDRPVLRRR